MDKVYAVCGNSSIDGGAPGKFIFCVCKDKNIATKIKTYINTRYRSCKGNEYLAFTDESPWYFGYDEGMNGDAYVEEIPIADAILSYASLIAKYEAHIQRLTKEDEIIRVELEEKEKERLAMLEEQRQLREAGIMGDDLYELMRKNAMKKG